MIYRMCILYYIVYVMIALCIQVKRNVLKFLKQRNREITVDSSPQMSLTFEFILKNYEKFKKATDCVKIVTCMTNH